MMTVLNINSVTAFLVFVAFGLHGMMGELLEEVASDYPDYGNVLMHVHIPHNEEYYEIVYECISNHKTK